VDDFSNDRHATTIIPPNPRESVMPACSPKLRLTLIAGGISLLFLSVLGGCGASSSDDKSGGAGPGNAGSTSSAGHPASSGGSAQAGSNPGGVAGAAGTTTGTAGSGGSGGGSAGTVGSAGSGGSTGGTGGTAAAGRGGAPAAGGAAGAAGSATAGGPGAGGGGAATPSAGCGKAPTLKNSPTTTINYNKITTGGKSRQYILRYPSNYDNMHPYRLIIAYHWLSGSASQVFDCNTESIKCYTTKTPFYGLWDLAKDSTIFIAPDGLNAGWGNANGEDVVFTDDMLKQVEEDLCIDKSRIFANGFSYGGGMSKAIGCARANVFRGIAVYSGADFLSGCDGGTMPIAFYGSHATDDPTNGYSSGIQILNRFAKNNGCTSMTPPMPPSGGHTCVDFAGCSAGHPTRWCAFQGSNKHDPSPRDPGQSASWNPPEVWKFITQF